LQAQGVLPANANATDACAPFTALNECLATLHASHNLGIEFKCLRASVTAVLTNADLSGCKAAGGDKALSLSKAIRAQSPEADAAEAGRPETGGDAEAAAADEEDEADTGTSVSVVAAAAVAR